MTAWQGLERTTLEHLERLFEAGLELWQDGGALRFRAPAGSLSPPDLEMLKGHREVLLAGILEGDRASFPLIAGQRALWHLHQRNPESASYNIAFAAYLAPNVALDAVESALQSAWIRHPMLRARLGLEGSEPRQWVEAEASLELTREDGSGWDEKQRQRWLAEKADGPFDPRKGPLFRAALLTASGHRSLLVLMVHHLITDFWSLELLLRELRASYGLLRAGRALDFPPVRGHYRRFVRRQREVLAKGERGWARYWKRRLGGPLPLLELPLDRPRMARADQPGREISKSLSPGLVEQIKSWARERGVTPFVVTLSAYFILLARYTGQREILVGTPTVGRDRAEDEDVFGFFVNMVAIRCRLQPNLTAERFLKRVQVAVFGAMDHRGLPFPQLVEMLQPRRIPGRSPLFQTAFIYDRYHAQESSPGDPRGRRHEDSETAEPLFDPIMSEQRGAPSEWAVTLFAEEERLTAAWRFSEDLFDVCTVGRAADGFLHILDSLTSPAGKSPEGQSYQPLLGELTPLAAVQRHQLLVEWSSEDRAGEEHESVLDQVRRQARRNPEAVAVQSSWGELTYAELMHRSQQWATTLRQRGVGPEVRVGLFFQKSPDLVVSLLAVLGAGGAYVPLEPNDPGERIRFLAQDASLSMILTHSPLASRLREAIDGMAVWEVDAPEANGHGAAGKFSPVSPEQLAYVLYTSGSTGRPKGVLVPHGGLSSLMAADVEDLGLGPGDRFFHLVPFSFDAATLHLFRGLAAGATVVFSERGDTASPEALAAALNRQGITVGSFPASLLVALSPEQRPQLRTVTVGSEACPPGLVERWAPHRRLFNFYGPTEGTIVTTRARLRVGQADIGRPIAGRQIFVVDHQQRPVPCSVAGELVIGGLGIARGYQGKPGRTAESFVPDSLSGVAGGRLYRSGDRVRHRPDGRLEFLGRQDDQIKIRGVRIELGEVEVALASLPGVQRAVAIAWQRDGGAKRLVAYAEVPLVESPQGDSAELAEDPQPSFSESSLSLARSLRASLAELLPAVLLPSQILVVDRLPLTDRGKVNRAALPDPDLVDAGPKEALETEVEHQIAAIWREVLELDEVGRRDDFFHLGGHSLLAGRILARIRSQLSVDIPLESLFEKTVLEELAGEVEGAMVFGKEVESIPLVDRAEPLPVAFGQRRLWFIHRAAPNDPAHNMGLALRLRGPLRVAALNRSLERLVDRHESLRCRFEEREGAPILLIDPSGAGVALVPEQQPAAGKSGAPQLVHQPAAPQSESQPVPQSVLQPRAAEPRRDEVASSLDDLLAQPFDLAEGPLLRTKLLRFALDDHALLITLHHIVCDGWSMEILLRELAEGYRAEIRGGAPELPDLTVGFADFAAWQRLRMAGDRQIQGLARWREFLEGAPEEIALPADGPRREAAAGAMESFHLGEALWEPLKEIGKARKATPFVVLLTLFQLLLHRLSGQDDLVVGTPSAHRDRQELEPLIGFFLDTLALRSKLKEGDTFSTSLERTRDTFAAAREVADVPFELVVQELSPVRSAARNPLFQVFFNLVNAAPQGVDLPDLDSELVNQREVVPKFDLTLYAREERGGVTLDLSYLVGRFDRWRVREMLEQFASLARQAVCSPEMLCGDLSLVTETTRRALLSRSPAAATDPATESSWDGSVLDLFALQVARQSAAPAVVAPEGIWSYGELDRRAMEVARDLARLGVKRGSVVAVEGRRHRNLLPSLLGIMRCGAAFWVMDPSQPKKRLQRQWNCVEPRAWIDLAGGLSSAIDQEAPRLLLPSSPLEAEPESPLPSIESPLPRFEAHEMAYAAMTSGSTGEPKGIAGSHGGLSRFFPWMIQRFDLGATDRFSLLSGVSHDPLHRDVFLALAAGAAIHVPPEAILEGGHLAQWVEEERITVANLTPSLARLVSRTAEGEMVFLRWLFLVGEALDPSDACAALERAPQARVVNLYGTTETQQSLAFGVFDLPSVAEGGRWELAPSLPLLESFPGVRVRIQGARGGLAGRGEVGEVWLISRWLYRGYLGEPGENREGQGRQGEAALHLDEGTGLDEETDLAEETGLDVLGDKSVRHYRTGDLGTYLEAGEVRILGRRDGQMQVRGIRVESAEVVAALKRHPGIVDAAVCQRRVGEEVLFVAYLCCDPSQSRQGLSSMGPSSVGLSIEELRSHLRQWLPPSLVPSRFLCLDYLPLTANGKVDFGALPPIEPVAAGNVRPDRELSPLEAAIASAWAEVLEVEQVALTDDFFALGGHSLLAMRVLSRLQRDFGVELPVSIFFESPTVEGLARRLALGMPALESSASGSSESDSSESGSSEDGVRVPILERIAGAEDQPVRASWGQRRLWFLAALDGDRHPYNLTAALRLRGNLDRASLVTALELVMARHEALRTTFLAESERNASTGGAHSEDAHSEDTCSEETAIDHSSETASEAFLDDAWLKTWSSLPLPFEEITVPDTVPEPSSSASDSSSGSSSWSNSLAAPLAAQLAAPLAASLSAAATEPFDLCRGPLVRWRLLNLGQDDQVIALTVHHAIADGWSLGILARELGQAYSRLCSATRTQREIPQAEIDRGELILGPPPALRYRDYAHWQRDSNLPMKEGLEFWRRRLEGHPPALDMPLDRPRRGSSPGESTAQDLLGGQSSEFKGGVVHGALGKDTQGALEALGRQHGCTLYMVMLAGWQLLLHRWTSQRRTAVGSPVAHRPDPRLEEVVGFFVNTVVMTADFAPRRGPKDTAGEGSSREVSPLDLPALLADVRSGTLASYAHQWVPFEAVVEALNPDRDLSHNPLFQVLFSLQNTPAARPVFEGLEVEAVPVPRPVAHFDLSLTAVAQDVGLRLALEFRSHLFDRVTVLRLLEAYEQVLQSLARGERSLAAISHRSPAQTHQLIIEWNESGYRMSDLEAHPTPLSADSSPTFLESWWNRVRDSPDSPAVATETAVWSATRLDALAQLVAGDLLQRGLGREEVVALSLERSPELVAAMLGILQAGAAYLPLDPWLPQERIEALRAEAGARWLLDDEALSALGIQDAVFERSPPDPQQLAYILFTSGSTGKPKGVMISHGNLGHLVSGVRKVMALGPESRVLQLASSSFDASVCEIFATLAAGGTVVVPATDGLLPRDDLPTVVSSLKVNHLTAPPSVLRTLEPSELPSLETLISAGEACDAELVERWSGDRRFLNAYGPTEATVCTTVQVCQPGGEPWIGRPIPGAAVHLESPSGGLGLLGAPGEMMLAGTGLARGYWGQPGLTAAKFRPNAHGEAGSRVYASGDLARQSHDGSLHYLGRVDRQVKVRGMRIEPGEIEGVLKSLPGVGDAVVEWVEDRWVAYISGASISAAGVSATGSGEHTPAEHGLREDGLVRDSAPKALEDRLRALLPEAMRPQQILYLEELPLNRWGKVDRQQLPAPPPLVSTDPSQIEPFATPEEEFLAAIWQRVLRVDALGRQSNFFALGGDSIQGMRVVAEVRRSGYQLAHRQLFEFPVLSDLAAVLAIYSKTASPKTAAPQGPIDSEAGGLVGQSHGEFPLTPIQRWFFDQVSIDQHHWNQGAVLQIPRQIKPEMLDRAWTQLVHRHEALRQRFVDSETSARARSFEARGGFPVERFTLEGGEEGWRASLVMLSTELQESLDLASGPLFRIAHLHRPEFETDLLLLIIHHLAVDGVSWRVLSTELQSLCSTPEVPDASRERSSPSVDLGPVTPFSAWARSLENWIRGGGAAAQVGYWQRQQRSQGVSLPKSIGGALATVASSRRQQLDLDPPLTAELLAKGGVGTVAVLLTALAKTIAEWAGPGGLRLDLEGHGREPILEDLEISNTVGWFTAVYPLYLDIDGFSDLGSALREVEQRLRAVPQGGIGYGALKYGSDRDPALHDAEDDGGSEVLFNYLGQFDGLANDTSQFVPLDEDIGPLRSLRQLRLHSLEVSAWVRGGSMTVAWGFSSTEFTPETIEARLERFLGWISRVVGSGDGREEPDPRVAPVQHFGFEEDTMDDVLEQLAWLEEEDAG